MTTQVSGDGGTSAKVTSFVDLLPSLSAPALDLNGEAPGNSSIAVVEAEFASAFVAPDLIVTAPTDTIESATITLTTRPNATDEILFVDPLETNIEVSEYNEDTGVLTLSGTDTVENYQEVLRTLEYITFLESPDTSNRLITFVVSDGTNSSTTFTAVVEVEPPATTPLVDLNGAADGIDFGAFFEQGGSPVPIASGGATIEDVDSENLVGARVTIPEIFDAGQEFLLANVEGTNISATYDQQIGVLTLDGADSIANYELVLRTVRYENTAFRPSPLSRDITFEFSDGEQFGLASVSFVDVGVPLPAPRIDLNGPDIDGIDIVGEYVEDSGPLVLAPNLTLTHAAGTDLEFADVQLFDCFGDEFCELNESLIADTTGTSITANYIVEEGRLILEGPDTLDNFQRVLRSVAYENRSQAFEFLIEEFDFFAIDVNGEDNTWTLATLEMKNVNDAPVLDTSFSFQLPVSLGECGQGPDESQGIFEDDLDSCFQEIGDLTDDVVLSEFYLGNDEAAEAFDDVDLFFTDFEEDDDLQFPSIAVVDVDNTNGLWQFSTDFAETWRTFENVSEANAVLLSSDIANRIRFVPGQDFNGTITNGLSFRAWDQTTASPNILEELKRSGRRADTRTNGGTTAFSQAIGEVSITVFPVNDAPTFVAGPAISVASGNGQVVLPNWANNISAGPDNEVEQSLSFSVTTDDDSLFTVLPTMTSDGTLSFTPAENANGTASVTIRLSDDGGTENGGIDSSSQTVPITIGNRLAGDINGDGAVGVADFLVLSRNFGTEVDQGEDGDLNEDGLVNVADFLILSRNFGRRV